LPTIEVCQLIREGKQEKNIWWYWWEARQASSQGGILIASSEKFKDASWELSAKEGLMGLCFQGCQTLEIRRDKKPIGRQINGVKEHMLNCLERF